MDEETKQPFDEVITDPEKAKKMKYELKCPHCGENTLVDPGGASESGIVDDKGKMSSTGGKLWVYPCENEKCKKTSAIADDLHTKL